MDVSEDTWVLITNFGDSAVMGPAALAIALWLAGGGAWRASITWAAVLGAGIAVVAATKIAFLGWDIGIASIAFKGVSGHSLLAVAIPLTAIRLSTRRWPTAARAGLLCGGVVVGLAIGISRLALQGHSVSEVVAGLVLGMAVALGFAWLTRPMRPSALPAALLVVALVVIAVSLHGREARLQDWMIDLARYFSGHQEIFSAARSINGTA